MAHTVEKNMDSSDIEEGERGSIKGDLEKQDIPHPWPYLSEIFDVVHSTNNSW